MHSFRSRGRWATAVSVTLLGVALGHLFDAFELRRRRGQIPALAPHGGDAEPAAVDVFHVEGVVVDERSRADAAAEMAASGGDVIDLVPGDLPVEPALRFLRRVNPDRLGLDRAYTPGGVHEALAVRSSVTRLLRESADEPRRRPDMVPLTMRAQRYASKPPEVRVAPMLRARERTPMDRWREMEGLMSFAHPYVRLSPLFLVFETAHLAVLAAAATVAPLPAALAAAVWSAKPAIVFGGRVGSGALSPTGAAAASVLRLPRTVATTAAVAVAGYRDTRGEAAGFKAVPPPDDAFWPPRSNCPWCLSADLVPLVDVGDLYQSKPGVFHLDECRDCGHVFQNPCLSWSGLSYYYDEFYEGQGESLADALFAGLATNDLQRVEAIAKVAEPRSWLDVGTGHGHFCARAKARWPHARFEGLDMSESVEEAVRRGWLDVAHRGAFVDLAPGMPHDFDVVSMHHYLEHTLEPRRELAAAVDVLAPGGHLMVEVPDPESPWARRLGPRWFGYSQPQHLHLPPCANLVEVLEQMGLEIASVERGTATLSGDLLGAVAFSVQQVSRSPHLPWLAPATPRERMVRAGAVAVGLPAAAVALVADRVKDAHPGPDDVGNAYRIVARKPI